MHIISLRSLSLSLTLTTALVLPSGCADDDSSATTDGSSTGTVDPTTSAPTTVADTTAADTGTTTTAASETSSSAETSSSSAADSSESGSSGAAGLEIAGTWFEEFAPGEGITHNIDETQWEQLASFGNATFHVDGYDNAERWLVAQGDASNEFYPELYSRFDWTWDGDALFYCTAVFDAATGEDAQSAPASDPDDLDMGCGGFPWSALLPLR